MSTIERLFQHGTTYPAFILRQWYGPHKRDFRDFVISGADYSGSSTRHPALTRWKESTPLEVVEDHHTVKNAWKP